MAIDFSKNMGYIIEMFGVSVTLRRRTKSINKYGDDDGTYIDETIKVGVNDIAGESDWSRYGILIPGDKIFFIKSSVDEPSVEDEIIYRTNTYKIVKIQSPDSGYISHYECWCKKV